MLESINNMLKEFEKNGIIYCHWKSNEHLLPALEGDTDLDMLFMPEQRNVIDRVLNECGIKRFRSTFLSQYNAIEDYIGFDEAEAKIWHLHLHYRLTIGEKHLKSYTITPWTKKILQFRIQSSMNCYSSCPEHELLLLYIRMSLKLRFADYFGTISRDDITEINWLVERVDWDKFRVLSSDMISSNSAEMIKDIAEKRCYKKSVLFKLKKAIRKELRPFTYYSGIGASITSYIRTIYSNIESVNRHFGLNSSRPMRRVSPSGGCVIAFIGSDGAGKTTTINYIKKEFGKKLDIKTAYLGSGDGECSFIRKPMRFVAKRVGGKGLGLAVEKEYSSKGSEEHISIKSRLYSIAKVIWAITLANEKKSKLKRVTKARNRGMLVLIDRYPQCEYPGYGDGPLLSKYKNSSNGILAYFAKKEFCIYQSAELNSPDLFVKLTVPTDIAIQRKPEMTEDEINKKRDAVLNIFKENNCVVIDTSVDKKVSFSKVMKSIWGVL